MTEQSLMWIALVALPMVLLLATAGCQPFGAATPVEPARPPVLIPRPPPLVVAPYPDFIRSEQHLVGYWRLGERGDVPFAEDIGPLHLNGRYSNTADFGIKFAQTPGALVQGGDIQDIAPEFRGTTTFVEIDANPKLTPPEFSLEFWIKPTGGSTDPQIPICCYRQDDAGNPTEGYLLELTRTFSGTGAESLKLTARLAGGIKVEAPLGDGGQHTGWRYVVLTHQMMRAETTLFVNAQHLPPEVGTRYEAAGPGGLPLRMGAGRVDQTFDGAEFYEGLLDEVALYNAALTPAQVKAHFTRALSL